MQKKLSGSNGINTNEGLYEYENEDGEWKR